MTQESFIRTQAAPEHQPPTKKDRAETVWCVDCMLRFEGEGAAAALAAHKAQSEGRCV